MEGSGGKRRHSGRFPPDPPLERAIADLATRQHGVIALHQLRTLGLSASAARSRVAVGRLHRVHAGVFAAGHAPLTRNGHSIAAVLACGPGAALSHREAAALRELRSSNRTRIDVTSPGRRGRGCEEIEVHSAATLRPCDVEEVDGIPCTTVARTLLDLAEVTDRRQVERACDRAEVLEVLDLIAELDGHRVHSTRRAFEHDRRRDQRLMLAGYRVVRFTWRQVTSEPATAIAILRTLLARHAA